MKLPHLLAAAAMALAFVGPAQAQTARVVTDCALATAIPSRDPTNLLVDQFNRVCMAIPTAAAGKITKTSTAITANTSTTIAAANANRVAVAIQCGAGAVAVDETGAALAGAGVGDGTLFIPTGTGAYFTPPIATLTAITARSATAQTCVVTEYLR